MIPFNYHHLYYFYVIAQEGTIARATKVLRLAQPTISAQLKQFENFLGVKLFIRENQRLTLTEEGHQVLTYAKTIFDIGQELKDRMVDLSYKGRLRLQIGITNFVPRAIVEVLLNHILDTESRAFIQLDKDNLPQLIQRLDDHLLDIVLTDTPFESRLGEHFVYKLIGKIPIVFCAHPTIAKNLGRFPKCLDGQPLLLPSAPRQITQTIKEFFYEKNISPEVVAEIQDMDTVRRLALKGRGIAPINLFALRSVQNSPRLVILNKPEQCPLWEKVYLIIKKRKMINPIAESILKNFRLENYLDLSSKSIVIR